MVTGDNEVTAAAIARQCGILSAQHVAGNLEGVVMTGRAFRERYAGQIATQKALAEAFFAKVKSAERVKTKIQQYVRGQRPLDHKQRGPRCRHRHATPRPCRCRCRCRCRIRSPTHPLIHSLSPHHPLPFLRYRARVQGMHRQSIMPKARSRAPGGFKRASAAPTAQAADQLDASVAASEGGSGADAAPLTGASAAAWTADSSAGSSSERKPKRTGGVKFADETETAPMTGGGGKGSGEASGEGPGESGAEVEGSGTEDEGEEAENQGPELILREALTSRRRKSQVLVISQQETLDVSVHNHNGVNALVDSLSLVESLLKGSDAPSGGGNGGAGGVKGGAAPPRIRSSTDERLGAALRRASSMVDSAHHDNKGAQQEGEVGGQQEGGDAVRRRSHRDGTEVDQFWPLIENLGDALRCTIECDSDDAMLRSWQQVGGRAKRPPPASAPPPSPPPPPTRPDSRTGFFCARSASAHGSSPHPDSLAHHPQPLTLLSGPARVPRRGLLRHRRQPWRGWTSEEQPSDRGTEAA